MYSAPEAFLLLTLPNASLTNAGKTENGNLDLESVTMTIPGGMNAEVYLVLRINSTEVALDPSRAAKRTDAPAFRTYTFNGTPSDPSQLVVRVMLPPTPQQDFMESLTMFDGILEQYLEEFQEPSTVKSALPSVPKALGSGNQDLRGKLVMIDEDTGHIVGEVENKFKIKEDPAMQMKGHENDPVIIEVPEGATGQQITALEAFARIVPPDQQNWMTKGSSIVRLV